MKRLHIALLVLAGALAGAIVMNVAQKSRTVAPAPVAALSQVPSQAAAEPIPAPPETPPAEAAAAPAPEPEKPSPLAKKEAAPRPRPARSASPASNPEPVAVARYAPPIPPAPAAPEVSAPVPEPPQETPAPSSAPARPTPENATPAATPIAPPPPNQVTLKAGMLMPVRLVDGLSSERNKPGDVFTATLDKELAADGFVIAERGARVEGRVAASDRGGKVKGVATLTVQLTRLHTSDGQAVAVATDGFEKRAEPSHGEDAAKIGAGAVVGAAIGALAGGGKGAAIGAGVGGGAGAGDVLLTRGKPATLPSETRISFRLHAPVTITERQ
jgi:hypothetical protein